MITEHDSIFVIKYISNKINNGTEKEVVLPIAGEAKKRQAQLLLGGRKQKSGCPTPTLDTRKGYYEKNPLETDCCVPVFEYP